MYKEKNTIMKRLFIGMGVVIALTVGLSGCGDMAKTTYNGPDYVMFADTMSLFPVQNSQDYFTVPVASTVACDYDRTFAVEVDEKASNAIEKKHYVIESNTVTIKAGERAADLKIRGIYENIGKTDSLSITLRLVSNDETRWDIYGTKTRVEMMKSCPFDLNVFTGWCKVSSSFYQNYMNNIDFRLIQTEIDKEEENTIIMHDFFYKGYDLKLKFDPSDPMEPFVEMEDQVLGSTSEAFGTIYGNGKLMVKQPTIYTSYYNVCQTFVLQYITVYVKDVDTVGTYINVLEWISDEEAERLQAGQN